MLRIWDVKVRITRLVELSGNFSGKKEPCLFIESLLFRKEKERKDGRSEHANKYSKANFFLASIAGGIYNVSHMKGMMASDGFDRDFT